MRWSSRPVSSAAIERKISFNSRCRPWKSVNSADDAMGSW